MNWLRVEPWPEDSDDEDLEEPVHFVWPHLMEPLCGDTEGEITTAVDKTTCEECARILAERKSMWAGHS